MRKKVLLKGRCLTNEEKGFAKRERFNQGGKRCFQEGDI
jgi:hypothetical protein